MLTEKDVERYGRQIMIFGEEGQERLKSARVFIAGAGGLGSPIAVYLATAGVGSIRLVDHDVVEPGNLNRQILHWERDVGKKKIESAEEKLREINPDIDIETFSAIIDESNAFSLVSDADLIVDAVDNFPTRYLLNHIARIKGVPLVHGAVRGFDGQATTIIPGRTACLRCIFPRAPPQEVTPVIGITPGIIGLIQANEAVKYILGNGKLLANRLLLWDGLSTEIHEIAVEQNPCCEECGNTGMHNIINPFENEVTP